MDRRGKPEQPTKSVNWRQVSETHAAVLANVTDQNLGPTNFIASDVAQPIGAQVRSEITRRRNAGGGAKETADGPNSSEEALRRGAEDVPIGAPVEDIEDVPVFDRADALPKV